MKAKGLVFTFLALLLMLGGTPVYAEGVPPLPHAFYGSVEIDGQPAPIGTVVSAGGEGIETTTLQNPITTTVEGSYGIDSKMLLVQAEEGADVDFYVNGIPTGQTIAWESGATTRVDLSVTTIGVNQPPSVESVSISPDPATTNSTLTATPSGWYDPDGDTEDYKWQWQKNGSDIPGVTSYTLDSSHFEAGDEIKVKCTPFDGTNMGSSVEASIIISGSPTVQITSPTSGYFTVDATVTVEGRAVATPPVSQATLTVNGTSSTIPVTDDSFSKEITLLKGTNTVEVAATNIIGTGTSGVITITRRTIPAVTVTSPADGAIFGQGEISVAGTVDAIPGATKATITLNGIAQPQIDVTAGVFSGPVTLTEGPNTIAVSATNAAGTGTSSTVTVTLNSEAPTVTITSPAIGSVTTEDEVTVKGTIVDIPAITEAVLTVNGAATTIEVSDGSFSEEVTLAEGRNTIEVSATDGQNTGSSSVVVTLDTSPPVVSISSPPNNYIVGGSTLTINGEIDDTSITKATLTVNGIDTTPLIDVTGGSFTATATLQADENTICVTATDAAGNTGSSGNIIVILDTTKPAVTITSPRSGQTTGNVSLMVTGTVVDDPAITQATLYLNGVPTVTPVTANLFSKNVTLSPGVNTIKVTATDAAGNVGSSGIVTITLDKTAPRITLTSPRNGLLLGTTSVTVSGTIDDLSVTTATLAVNGVTSTISVARGAFSTTATNLREGSNTVLVAASDAYGNRGTSGTITIEVDTAKPTVSITSPSSGLVTKATSLAVSGTVSDDITEATLVHNGVSRVIPVSSDRFGTTITLVEGTNTIVVTATHLGNTGSSGVVTVTRDTSPPSISLTSPAPGLFVNTASLAVSGTVDDPGVTTATLTLNGIDEIIPVVARTFSRTVTNLNNGQNTIAVSASDRAGNIGTAGPITVHLYTDKPAVTIESPENGYLTNQSSINVSGTVTHDIAISSASLILNGSPRAISLTDNSFSQSVSLLSGINTIEVTATDDLGNMGRSGQITVTRDSTAPTLAVSLSDPTDTILITVRSNEPLRTPPTVTINPGAIAVDMTLVDVNKWTGTYPAAGTLAEGSYSVSISGTDRAGNATSRTATFCKKTVTIAADETKEVTTDTTKLEVQTIDNVTDASISVTQHIANPAENTESEEEAGVFVDIIAGADLRDKIESVYIQVNYDEDEIAARGIDESSLKLYLWDVSTGRWEVVPGSGVNTVENYVYGTVTHLSTYGAFGTAIVPPPPPPPTPSPGVEPPSPPAGKTSLSGMVNWQGVMTQSVTAKSFDDLCRLIIDKSTTALTSYNARLTWVGMYKMVSPPSPPEDTHVIGVVYDFQPDGATFDPPVTLAYSYDPSLIPEGVAEKDLVIAYYDEGAKEWVELESVVDTEAKTITAKVSHFTSFTVLGKATPVAFIINTLSISPSEVNTGEAVTISLLVTNAGGKSGSHTVVLKINGVKEAEKSVTINASSSETVSFAVTKQEAGNYTVSVDGLSGSFTVIAPPAPPAPPPVPSPATFSVSNLFVKPAEVQSKEMVTITVSVANTGGMEGSYSVVLKINDVKEADKSVTVAAGKSETVTFSITKEEAGTYSVEVDGLKGSFTVAAPLPPTLPVKPPINWPVVGGIIAGVIAVGLLIFFLVRRRAD
jgi:uncharacterized protein YfaP (DUF2135 family)